MIIDLPADIKNRADIEKLHLEGAVSYQHSNKEKIRIKWTVYGAVYELVYDLSLGKLGITPEPPVDVVDLLKDGLSHEKRQQAKRQVKEIVKELVRQCEGVAITDLEPLQVRSLLLALLLKQKAIGTDMRIKPVEMWIK
jgi:hypothetical protein